MQKLNLMMYLLGLLCCISCQDSELPILEQCGGSKVVKKAKKQKGIFRYNSYLNRYIISVHELHTIDVVDVGLICNMPAITTDPSIPEEGRTVIFNGKYRQSAELSPVAGITYYELELSKIDFVE
ncbi:MAG TPA: hypothetical protein VK014_16325 [Cyclobacteriaceae bacterium]|nr:hypothetical protein [Cyclobacteriaceae bacterium]